MLIKYTCEGCGLTSDVKAAVERCEARKPGDRVVKVGDIVTKGAGYGWYDGDGGWVKNPKAQMGRECPNGHGNCFQDCCTFVFFYVVTFIEESDHMWKYHLETEAMTGKSGHRKGWVTSDYNIRKVPRVRKHVRDTMDKIELDTKAKWYFQ